MKRLRAKVEPTLRAPVVLWREVFTRPAVVVLVASLVLLATIGLVILASLSWGVADAGARAVLVRQLASLGVGLFAAIVVANIDYRFWKTINPILVVVTLGALAAVLFFSAPIRGIRAWVTIGGATIQVSEFAKFSFIVFLAQYASRWTRHLKRLNHLLVTLVGAAAYLLLILFEPDFGTTALLMFVWASFVFSIGLGRRQLMVLLLSACVLGTVLWVGVLRPYQKQRVFTFLNPTRDPQGSGYNVRQSLAAIGSGGVFGLGVAQGSQSQLRFLPESQSDFIFSVIGETFGLVGLVLVYGLWSAVFVSLLFLLPRLVEDFAAFFTLAFTILLFWEVIIPMAIALALFPVTGLALPLMSAGGSSLVAHLMMIGVVFNILKNTPLRIRDEVTVLG